MIIQLRNVGCLLILAMLLAGGCRDDGPGDAAPPEVQQETPQASNRIDIPQQVRDNLGITFAKVESRRVAATLRVPGRFELQPSARREYRTILPARVELLVKQYDRVEPDQVIARLDSPDWRRMQHEAVEAEGEIKVAMAGIDIAKATVAENEKAVQLLSQRVATLAEANSPRAELTSELAVAKSKSARLEAEARAASVKLAEAKEHYASKLRTLAAVLGVPAARLVQPATQQASGPASADAQTGDPHGDEPIPMWRSIETVDIRAASAGVVESLAITNGGWADASSLLMTVIDPNQLRFRAAALQADMGRLTEGASAEIVPPSGGLPSLSGRVHIGLEASPDLRTVELVIIPDSLAPWARPGVSAFADITTSVSDEPQPAIPVAAVIQDELTKIYFRRDPRNPDKVIRVEADLGTSNGRWVVVKSGVKVGDEVVLDGVYELKLTGAGKSSGAGGHFHADGTWHPDSAPEKK